MRIFEGKNVPIKSWCNNLEEGAIEQTDLVDIVVKLNPLAVAKG